LKLDLHASILDSRSRRLRSSLLPCLGLLSCHLLSVFVSSYLYSSLTNTLQRNGRWISSKTTLEKSVMGAVTYATTSRTLANERLDLGRWHGYQEVLYREPVTLRRISLDFLLSVDSYFILVFNKTPDQFSGLRLSRSELFESVYFVARDDGEFVSTQRLADLRLDSGDWMRLTVAFDERGFSGSVDARPLGRFSATSVPHQRVGFRGGYRSVLIDNVEMHLADTSEPIRESFFNSHGFRQAFMTLGILLAAAHGLALGPIRRGTASPRMVLLASFVAALTVLSCSLLSAAAYRYLVSKGYLTVGFQPRDDAEFGRRQIEDLRRDLRANFSESPHKGTIRILFVGTSQTWGAGAARASESFARILEDRLNANASKDLRFECINAGVSSLDARRLLALYAEEWVHLSPHLVVINLSTNDCVSESDCDVRKFAEALEEFLRIGDEKGIGMLLALEANSIERAPGDLALHPTMRSVAERNGVPLVELHGCLKQRRDRGLIWWDFVHPTSFSHRLIADCLHGEIERVTRNYR